MGLKAMAYAALTATAMAVVYARNPSIASSPDGIVLSVNQTQNVFVDRPNGQGGTQRVAVYDLLSRVEQLESLLSNFQVDLSFLHSNISTLDVRWTDLQRSTQANATNLQTNVSSLDNRVIELQRSVQTNSSVLHSNLSTLNSRVVNLQQARDAEIASANAANYTFGAFGPTAFTVHPNEVINATCVSSSTDEPYCPSNDFVNAKKALESFSGSVEFYVARSGSKTYYHTYDLGIAANFTGISLEGTSMGHWCEGSERNRRRCHNDNNFNFAFSTQNSSGFSYPNNSFVSEACSNLADGCRLSFDAIYGRFLRVEVRSGCSGCVNIDTVSSYTVYALEPPNATSTQFIVSRQGRVGVNTPDPQATLDITGETHVHGGPLRASGDAMRPSLIVEALRRTTLQPVALVSARCFATKNFNRNNRTNSYVDPRGAEPHCPLDDTANARNGLMGNGGSITYVVSSQTSHSKYYEHVFDMGAAETFVGVSLIGSSSGCWAEDGRYGCGRAHNDNSFSIQFSTNGTTFSNPPMTHHHEACNNIGDGCIMHFNATYGRYVKLWVRSGCHGCSNVDRIQEIHLIKQETKNALSVDKNGDIFIGGRKLVVRSDNSLAVEN